MAVARPGLDDRDDRILDDKVDEACAAAGNDDVDQAARLDQFLYRVARGRVEQLNSARWQARDRAQNFHQSPVAVHGLLATAQDDAVPRLKNEGDGVDCNVGARLVDDADHAKRNAHFTDEQAVWALPLRDGLTDRVG